MNCIILDKLPPLMARMSENYAVAASSMLWIADHVETLPTEFTSIWKRKITGASILFLVNKYVFLLFIVFGAILDLPGNGTNRQCQVVYILTEACASVSLVATNVIFALRVYAMYNKNGVIITVAIVFIISRFVLDVWVNQLAIPFVALGYDIFIFLLTAFKTLKQALAMRKLAQSSITQVIIRDGKYCIVIFFAKTKTIFNRNVLKLWHHSLTCESILNFEKLSNQFYRLPNLLISRLMLNLCTFSEPRTTTSTISRGQHTQMSSLNFASNRMLGNIGAPLDDGSLDNEYVEELEEIEVGTIERE
ncbi:hypothetical protein C8J55DRAFT_440206 [Lentinula edodes]|uniref:DUF6533 domain-containing protein n=1 Tax=Lentinula lateritia TaxID=40482 RepID=A0A9W9DEU3_9AGAR|nr:hypothetical protein C8J55DRAFT_440206 [Lentinula edodes]